MDFLSIYDYVITINPITIQSNIEAAFRKKCKTTKKSRMPTCWGCVGTTGAFMFYHPVTEAIIIGTFNDFSYRAKALGVHGQEGDQGGIKA